MAKTLADQFSEKVSTRPLDVCSRCFGTGTLLTETGARICECRRTDHLRVARLLERIPPRYKGVSLATLQPNPDLHTKQTEIVEYLRQHPDHSYYFCGANDTGKSHFLWALYENAARAGRRVVAGTFYDMVKSAKAAFDSSTSAELRWSQLRYWQADLDTTAERCLVCIDDIDKARPTEYVAELFFSYVDAIYNFKHQLVVTSQLDPQERVDGRDSLIEHFERADPRYAVGIVRRVVNDETAIWRMF